MGSSPLSPWHSRGGVLRTRHSTVICNSKPPTIVSNGRDVQIIIHEEKRRQIAYILISRSYRTYTTVCRCKCVDAWNTPREIYRGVAYKKVPAYHAGTYESRAACYSLDSITFQTRVSFPRVSVCIFQGRYAR